MASKKYPLREETAVRITGRQADRVKRGYGMAAPARAAHARNVMQMNPDKGRAEMVRAAERVAGKRPLLKRLPLPGRGKGGGGGAFSLMDFVSSVAGRRASEERGMRPKRKLNVKGLDRKS